MKLAVVKRRKAGDAVILCSEPIFPVMRDPLDGFIAYVHHSSRSYN